MLMQNEVVYLLIEYENKLFYCTLNQSLRLQKADGVNLL